MPKEKKKITPDGRHLKEEDREYIAAALQINTTFKDIAANLSKDPTTIAKEVKANRTFKQAGNFSDGSPNLCISRRKCEEAYLCPPNERGRHCIKGCRRCSRCNEVCRKFEKEECHTLKKAPFVCNGCRKKSSCFLEKYYYRAVTAHKKYGYRLRTSRMGIQIGEDECMELDSFITPLVRKGQPISHIYNSCPEKMPCSKSTLYRYVNSGALSLKNIDLRSVVRYKQRQKKAAPRATFSRKGRTYRDFLEFTAANPGIHIWEMDIVEGKKGGKVLLTLFSRETKLMLMFLLERNTQAEVLSAINFLEEQIGAGLFLRVFQVILTDNGSSFQNALEIESSFFDLKKRTYLFFCDPYSSFQKGGIEKNHEYIRWVLPKGSSFDHLSWQDIGLLASHINSIARDSLDGLTPYKTMKLLHPSLLERVHLAQVPASEVTLTPGLLK